MVLSHLALELLTKTRYWRNYMGKDGSDAKTRKRGKQLLDILKVKSMYLK
jgi:hypothetical protein